jgi:chromosome partitioning protein
MVDMKGVRPHQLSFWRAKVDNSGIGIVIDRAEHVLDGETLPVREEKFNTYAVTNFRGGIGKSTLSFNMAYEMSRNYQCLFLDACPQRNFSQNIFGDRLSQFNATIYDALISEITNTKPPNYMELVEKVNPYCDAFAGGKLCYMIPGSSELFLFPSLLYSQLAQYAQLGGRHQEEASKKVLLSLKTIIEKASEIAKPEKVLIDTSPFFGGATHLSWCAAEALIIPVRVDQHSVEALKLTLKMLDDEGNDFYKFNRQAGLGDVPKVHAIVMTHCGWNRQKKNTPDSSTTFFVGEALRVASEYKHLFSDSDITNCFYLMDDFHSSGRISGKQRIPLAKLIEGQKFIVDGQRLEVNPSISRYKKEVNNLTAAL